MKDLIVQIFFDVAVYFLSKFDYILSCEASNSVTIQVVKFEVQAVNSGTLNMPCCDYS